MLVTFLKTFLKLSLKHSSKLYAKVREFQIVELCKKATIFFNLFFDLNAIIHLIGAPNPFQLFANKNLNNGSKFKCSINAKMVQTGLYQLF